MFWRCWWGSTEKQGARWILLRYTIRAIMQKNLLTGVFMPPTSSFTPDFDDPRTLGWGGRRQFSGSTIIFICLLALGVLWMAFAMLYGAHSKEII